MICRFDLSDLILEPGGDVNIAGLHCQIMIGLSLAQPTAGVYNHVLKQWLCDLCNNQFDLRLELRASMGAKLGPCHLH